MKLKALIQLMRPEQWVKNFFVLVPLFFNRTLLDADYLLPTLVAFAAFCFISSSIYCLNDIQDVERDRRHPKKCKRPIAAGLISVAEGWTLMLLCIAVSVAITFLAGPRHWALLGVILTYLVLNLAYSFKLKQFTIIDVFIIATGFVLRIFAGGLTSGIPLTPWLVLMTFLLALFIAFAKRRDDVVIYEDTGRIPRKGVEHYNLPFMNQVIGFIAAITMVCYLLYTLSDDVVRNFGSSYVYLTSVWVLAAIIKYLQITIVDVKSGSPTKVLLHNRFIQFCILAWIVSFAIIIYC